MPTNWNYSELNSDLLDEFMTIQEMNRQLEVDEAYQRFLAELDVEYHIMVETDEDELVRDYNNVFPERYIY